MSSRDGLDSVLLALSEAPLSSSWEAALTELGRYLDAPKIALVPMKSDPCRFVDGYAVGYTSLQKTSYVEYFARSDVYFSRLLAAEDMRPQLAVALVSEAELVGSSIYNDWWLPSDMRYALSVPIDIGAAWRFVLSCVRPRGSKDFSDDDLRAVGIIAQYVRQSLRVEHMMRETNARLGAAHWTLEQLSIPTIFLSKNCRIVFANDAAIETLQCGGAIGTRDGCLLAKNNAVARRLNEAIEAVACGRSNQKAVSLIAESGARRASALILRIPRQMADGLDLGLATAELVVFVLEHQRRAPPPPEFLMSAFGLTPKEASTASLLADGADLLEIAKHLNVSREGVRHHLKRLFWKTDTHSQRELAQVIASVVGPLRRWGDSWAEAEPNPLRETGSAGGRSTDLL
ncbi:MAG: helix-turn-helix transcriptional regulator [Bauldia sp.]|nr:helix-turn-helix transcriptional regulator [Bauldia sp.]